jgi:hypothetical protein
MMGHDLSTYKISDKTKIDVHIDTKSIKDENFRIQNRI